MKVLSKYNTNVIENRDFLADDNLSNWNANKNNVTVRKKKAATSINQSKFSEDDNKNEDHTDNDTTNILNTTFRQLGDLSIAEHHDIQVQNITAHTTEQEYKKLIKGSWESVIK